MASPAASDGQGLVGLLKAILGYLGPGSESTKPGGGEQVSPLFDRYATDSKSLSDYLRPPFPSPLPNFQLTHRGMVKPFEQALRYRVIQQLLPILQRVPTTTVINHQLPSVREAMGKDYWRTAGTYGFYDQDKGILASSKEKYTTLPHELTHAAFGQFPGQIPYGPTWPGKEYPGPFDLSRLSPLEEHAADRASGGISYLRQHQPPEQLVEQYLQSLIKYADELRRQRAIGVIPEAVGELYGR